MSLFLNTNKMFISSQLANRDRDKKNVSFSTIKYLHSIPTRQELISANLSNDLWWSNNDYVRFRFEAFNEIRALKERVPNINLRQSLKLLYQPGNICYDEANF